jgi:hypothetical protein
MNPAMTYSLDAEDASTMSRPIYVPIADSFFESSIMREEVTVRFVMLALIRLALRAGANGEVDIDPMMFAMSINLPFPEVEAALKRLMEPDPASSSPGENGCRIVPVDPARPFRNWRLVNWEKYRHVVSLANDAARKRNYRHTAKDNMDVSENIRKRPQASENVGTKYEVRNTKNEEREKREGARFVVPTMNEVQGFLDEKKFTTFDAEQFIVFYESKGWRIGKEPMRSWKAACVTWSKRDGRDGKAGAPAGTYPLPGVIAEFNKKVFGLSMEAYRERFKEHFGVDLREPKP